MNISACLSRNIAYKSVVTNTAQATGVSSRALSTRLLMQLPRIADSDGNIRPSDMLDEAEFVAGQLANDEALYGSKFGFPPPFDTVSDTLFAKLDPSHAQYIFGHLHYLRSYRTDSTTYALLHPSTMQPLAMCSISILQWNGLASLIEEKTGASRESIIDISRVFAFDTAPKNSISALLAKVRRELASTMPEVSTLSTAVDQNLGFNGNSYRADNWQLFCDVKARPYMYYQKRYLTVRQFKELFGNEKREQILRTNPDFELSATPLMPSLVFVRPMNHSPHLNRVYTLQREPWRSV